jgi:HEAT repeat protein
MEKIKSFFRKLNKRQRILAYVAIGLAVITFLHLFIWNITRSNLPTQRALLKQIKTGNKYEKIAAIYGLGTTNNKRLIPVFVKILMTDTEPEVKATSAWAIGNTDKNKLIELLQTDNVDVKLIVMDTLVKMGKENIDDIVQQLDDKNLSVKTYVIGCMEKYPDPKYNEKILSVAQNPSEDINIRLGCLDILKTTGTSSMESELSALSSNDSNEGIRNKAKEVVEEIRKTGGVE